MVRLGRSVVKTLVGWKKDKVVERDGDIETVEAEVETLAKRWKARSRLGARGLGWAWHATAREEDMAAVG
jgi:hypothetical protein